jgi:hypothetical protein
MVESKSNYSAMQDTIQTLQDPGSEFMHFWKINDAKA